LIDFNSHAKREKGYLKGLEEGDNWCGNWNSCPLKG